MDVALTLVMLVGVVVAFGSVARRIGVAAPLVLIVAGLAISYASFLPDVTLTPDLVLIGLLPPLLYAAAIRTPLIDVRREVRPILGLSVGLVLLTTVVVALVAWWVLPIPLAAAFAIGAVVAPPDAVAATSIARKVGMPRRMVTILEGESLLNDATAIVTLRASIAAIGGGLTVASLGWQFVVSGVGGVLIGVVVSVVVGRVRRRIDDDLTDVAVSFLTPWVAYLPAEEIGASGVLAVVVAGLVLGHRAPLIQSASSRVFERTNWATISFLLENTVFVLIGMQVRTIVKGVETSDVPYGQVTLAAVLVLLTVVLVRFVGVFAMIFGPRLVPAVRRREDPPDWRPSVVVGWAGMRGVVTLAAAFLLPQDTPDREVLVMLAFVVTVGTLMLQGLTLPLLVRVLGIEGPDSAVDRREAAGVLVRATQAGLDRLDELVTEDDAPEVVDRLRAQAAQRAERASTRHTADGPPPGAREYVRLRAAMIEAERAEVLAVRRSGTVDQAVVAHVLDMIDAEETVITRRRG
ncbi:Na+/H+ antiporter [Solicola sp. PLA-1-18]|uniref:Na+/H+ antiporter n=1 Tax=Solicola sp. PLA-1-18 TaxID=3380532 RepID=UPI003B7B6BEF